MAKGRKAKKTAALSHIDSAGAKKQKDEEISEKNESRMQPAIQKKTSNTLLQLSPEANEVIISHLDPTSSLCLGLTCKPLYAIHFSTHGPMTNIMLLPNTNVLRPRLYHFLERWMGEKYWVCQFRWKFVVTAPIIECWRMKGECWCWICKVMMERKTGVKMKEVLTWHYPADKSEKSDITENGFF